MSNKFSLTTSMTITFLNENYELKFIKIKYEKRLGQSKLGFKDFFNLSILYFHYCSIINHSKLFYLYSFHYFLTFILFLINDINSKDITDKTVYIQFQFFNYNINFCN